MEKFVVGQNKCSLGSIPMKLSKFRIGSSNVEYLGMILGNVFSDISRIITSLYVITFMFHSLIDLFHLITAVDINDLSSVCINCKVHNLLACDVEWALDVHNCLKFQYYWIPNWVGIHSNATFELRQSPIAWENISVSAWIN